MHLKYLVVVAVACGLMGCASRTTWDKSGASQQDFQTDSYACEKDSRQSGYFGSGLVGALNMQEFFGRCMNAHGWAARASPSSGVALSSGTAAESGDRLITCKLGVARTMMLRRECFSKGGTVEE